MKVDIIETLFAQRRAGAGQLAGEDQRLAERMIEDSDNAAATSLWNAVGGRRGIGSFNARVGMTGTVPASCVECPGFPWPGWGLTTTVPADQIRLLRQLVTPSRLLTGTERSAVLRLMENVTPSQRWGISGGIPRHVIVALKNGWLPLNAPETDWQVNSMGWVAGRGRDYLIAVLSTGNPTEQYGIDTINGLSARVWRAMS
ncbi:MAG TPA: serine hydrolase [Streptosporangiaceae bacterium]|nr:serine hydrolase [Streptosporangiaceae bacterium]